jgi:hypothetical protein
MENHTELIMIEVYPLSSQLWLLISYFTVISCFSIKLSDLSNQTCFKQVSKQTMQQYTLSIITSQLLVFVLMLISIFIDQNRKVFFAHVLKKDVLLFCA